MNIRTFYAAFSRLILLSFVSLNALALQAQGIFQEHQSPDWLDLLAAQAFPQPDGSIKMVGIGYSSAGTGNARITYYSKMPTVFDTLHLPYGYQDLYFFADDTYLMVNSVGNSQKLDLLDASGNLQWSQPVVMAIHPGLQANKEREIFLASFFLTAPVDSGAVWKFAADGSLLWKSQYGMNNSFVTVPGSLFPTSDGGCLVSTMHVHPASDTIELARKLDKDGLLVWRTLRKSSFYSIANDPKVSLVTQGTDGRTLILVQRHGLFTADSLVAELIDTLGNLVQSINLSDSLHAAGLYEGLVRPLADGGFVVVAITQTGTRRNYIVRLRADGSLAWQRTISSLIESNGYDDVRFMDGQELPDGSLIFYGDNYGEKTFLLKMSPDGVI